MTLMICYHHFLKKCLKNVSQDSVSRIVHAIFLHMVVSLEIWPKKIYEKFKKK
jgi:hypothetical protein